MFKEYTFSATIDRANTKPSVVKIRILEKSEEDARRALLHIFLKNNDYRVREIKLMES